MVARTSQLVSQKLDNLGISLKYRLWRTECSETWQPPSQLKKARPLIILNPEDRHSRVLAHRSVEHLLFHELGHIFVYKFVTRKLERNPEFIALFGDFSKHYRRTLARVKTSTDFISNYAQVHPEDNFCEVFATYCRFEGKIKSVYKHLKKQKKSDKVKKQVLWVHRFLKDIRA